MGAKKTGNPKVTHLRVEKRNYNKIKITRREKGVTFRKRLIKETNHVQAGKMELNLVNRLNVEKS